MKFSSFLRVDYWFSCSLSTTDITVVGSSTDGTTGRSYSVLQIVLHPDYSSTTLDYDFSCVQIDGTFYYGNKRAHRLPATEPATNSTMMVAGYGCTVSTNRLQANVTSAGAGRKESDLKTLRALAPEDYLYLAVVSLRYLYCH